MAEQTEPTEIVGERKTSTPMTPSLLEYTLDASRHALMAQGYGRKAIREYIEERRPVVQQQTVEGMGAALLNQLPAYRFNFLPC